MPLKFLIRLFQGLIDYYVLSILKAIKWMVR
jgi:hypothetical protein